MIDKLINLNNQKNLLHLNYGITNLSQYSFLFIMSLNPAIFKLFKLRHYGLFLIGILGSLINHRAILTVMLFILLDLDYTKLDKKNRAVMLFFFSLVIGILLFFGGWER